MSSYRTRVLPIEEWDRIKDLEISSLLPYARPEDVQIVVVEDGDAIVGCWGVFRITHVEGLWIDPAYRLKASVARRLLLMTKDVARAWRARWVMTGARDDTVRALLATYGALPLDMDAYVMKV